MPKLWNFINFTINTIIRLVASKKYMLIVPISYLIYNLPFFSCLSKSKVFLLMSLSSGIDKMKTDIAERLNSDRIIIMLSETFWNGNWTAISKFAQNWIPKYIESWIIGCFGTMSAQLSKALLRMKPM